MGNTGKHMCVVWILRNVLLCSALHSAGAHHFVEYHINVVPHSVTVHTCI